MSKDKGFTQNKWKGLDHFNCSNCNFETLDKSEIETHVRKVHGIKTLTAPAPVAGQTTTTTPNKE